MLAALLLAAATTTGTVDDVNCKDDTKKIGVAEVTPNAKLLYYKADGTLLKPEKATASTFAVYGITDNNLLVIRDDAKGGDNACALIARMNVRFGGQCADNTPRVADASTPGDADQMLGANQLGLPLCRVRMSGEEGQ